jgi:hypothetical protein
MTAEHGISLPDWPTDPFDIVLQEMAEMNRRKRADYATDDDPWSNFTDSGRQVAAPAGFAVEVLIATKQSRLRQLLGSGREVHNESVEDTLLDRAVYAVIALAMYRQGLYGTSSGDEVR